MRCSHCGQDNALGAVFCGRCGSRLGQPAAAVPGTYGQAGSPVPQPGGPWGQGQPPVAGYGQAVPPAYGQQAYGQAVPPAYGQQGYGQPGQPLAAQQAKPKRKLPIILALVAVVTVAAVVITVVVPRFLPDTSTIVGTFGVVPVMDKAPHVAWQGVDSKNGQVTPLGPPYADLVLTVSLGDSGSVEVADRASGRQLWAASLPGLRDCKIVDRPAKPLACLAGGAIVQYDVRSGSERGRIALLGNPEFWLAPPSGGWISMERQDTPVRATLAAYDEAGNIRWQRTVQAPAGSRRESIGWFGAPDVICLTTYVNNRGIISFYAARLDGSTPPDIPEGSTVYRLTGNRVGVVTASGDAYLTDSRGVRTVTLGSRPGRRIGPSDPSADDGSLPVSLVVSDEADEKVFAFDASGNQLGTWPGQPLGICAGSVYMLEESNTITAYDGAGRQRWQMASPLTAPLSLGTFCDTKRLIIWADDDHRSVVRLAAVDRGATVWTTEVRPPVGYQSYGVYRFPGMGILVLWVLINSTSSGGTGRWARTLLTP